MNNTTLSELVKKRIHQICDGDNPEWREYSIGSLEDFYSILKFAGETDGY